MVQYKERKWKNRKRVKEKRREVGLMRTRKPKVKKWDGVQREEKKNQASPSYELPRNG